MRRLAALLFSASLIACSGGDTGADQPPAACSSCSADAPHCLDGACVACIADADCGGDDVCAGNRCMAAVDFTIGGDAVHQGGAWLVDFGSVPFGQSDVRMLRVENTGATALRLDFEEEVPGFTVNTLGPLDIPAGGFRVIEVSFAPAGAGTIEASLLLNAGPAIAEVRLQGMGVKPALTCDAEVLDFGTVLIGSSAARAISCANETGVAFHVAVEVQRPFVLAGQVGNRVELPAGGRIDLEIELPPQRFPVEASRTLRLLGPDDEPAAEVELVVDSLFTWDVAGDGSLDFGAVLPGTQVTQTVQFLNRSGAEIPGTFALDGEAFSIDPADGFVLPVDDPSTEDDESLTDIAITFSPSGLDPYLGGLTISTSEGNRYISLRGRGRGPRVTCHELPTSLGRTAVGVPLPYRLACRNEGATASDSSIGDLVIESVRADGPGWSASVVGGIEPEGYAVGMHFLVDLTFDPAVAGTTPGTLFIASNDPLEPVKELALSADAVALPACNVQVFPAALDFGSMLPGTTVSLHVAVKNPDDHECLLHGFALAPGTTGFDFYSPGRTWLAGGAMKRITIRYTGDPGSHVGALRLLTSNLADPERLVPLTAVGGAGCLEPATMFNGFGLGEMDCRMPARPIAFTNVCAASVEITGAVVVDALDSFRIDSLPAFPVSLAPGARFEVPVSYEPSLPGGLSWERWESGAVLVSTSEAAAAYLAVVGGETYVPPDGHRFDSFTLAELAGETRLVPSIPPRDRDGDGRVTESDLGVFADNVQVMPTNDAGDVVWSWNAAAGAVEFQEGHWPAGASWFRLDYYPTCF